MTNPTQFEILRKKYEAALKKEKLLQKKNSTLKKRIDTIISEKNRELTDAHEKLKNVYTSFNSELEIAKKIQTGLLPTDLPEFPNLTVASKYLPTETVGGDMYGIHQKGDIKTAIFIFDVSGHGVPSALISAMAKMLFINHIKKHESPSEIFFAINKDICRYLKTGHYLTAFLGIINHASNQMIYSLAGHVEPILYHSITDTCTFLTGKGVFIGHIALSDYATYQDHTVSFERNDKLFLYTDGLTESSDPKGNLYGSNRLLDVVRKHGKNSPELLLKLIEEDNSAHRKGYPQKDDIALLCIQIGCSEEIIKISGFKSENNPDVLILSIYDEIEPTCSIILRNLDKNGYTDKEIFDAHLCLHELLSNAIKHGNKYNPDKKVYLLFKISLEHYYFSIIDEGDGFRHTAVPDPTSPENIIRDHGRGLYIVKKLMDKVQCNKKGNRVMIFKRHQREE